METLRSSSRCGNSGSDGVDGVNRTVLSAIALLILYRVALRPAPLSRTLTLQLLEKLKSFPWAGKHMIKLVGSSGIGFACSRAT
jgi:hypothetical protein